jgi:anti-anti-sigma factor
MEQLPYRTLHWRNHAVTPHTLPSAGSPAAARWQQITRGTKALMLARVANATAGAAIVLAGAGDGQPEATPLDLGHRVRPAGGAVVDIGGELDIATAEMAVRYVRNVVDHYPGPVIVRLAAVRFCDARGLSALLRMAGYAERAGCPFRLASPSPSVARIIRMTGLDRRFLG